MILTATRIHPKIDVYGHIEREDQNPHRVPENGHEEGGPDFRNGVYGVLDVDTMHAHVAAMPYRQGRLDELKHQLTLAMATPPRSEHALWQRGIYDADGRHATFLHPDFARFAPDSTPEQVWDALTPDHRRALATIAQAIDYLAPERPGKPTPIHARFKLTETGETCARVPLSFFVKRFEAFEAARRTRLTRRQRKRVV